MTDHTALISSLEKDLTPKLAGFAREVLGALWEGYDLDGADIQELGLKYGLITREAFDPEKHTDHLGVGVYPGDEWFVEIPALRAFQHQGGGNG